MTQSNVFCGDFSEKNSEDIRDNKWMAESSEMITKNLRKEYKMIKTKSIIMRKRAMPYTVKCMLRAQSNARWSSTNIEVLINAKGWPL